MLLWTLWQWAFSFATKSILLLSQVPHLGRHLDISCPSSTIFYLLLGLVISPFMLPFPGVTKWRLSSEFLQYSSNWSLCLSLFFQSITILLFKPDTSHVTSLLKTLHSSQATVYTLSLASKALPNLVPTSPAAHLPTQFHHSNKTVESLPREALPSASAHSAHTQQGGELLPFPF